MYEQRLGCREYKPEAKDWCIIRFARSLDNRALLWPQDKDGLAPKLVIFFELTTNQKIRKIQIFIKSISGDFNGNVTYQSFLSTPVQLSSTVKTGTLFAFKYYGKWEFELNDNVCIEE